MKKKKIIFYTLIILGICIIVGYILYPKEKNFKDSILAQYKNSKFDTTIVNSPEIKTNDGIATCKDETIISEFLSYLGKLKITDYEKEITHSKPEKYYQISIRNQVGYYLGLKVYEDDLNYIEINDTYGIKTYKLNNKFDINYVQKILDNSK